MAYYNPNTYSSYLGRPNYSQAYQTPSVANPTQNYGYNQNYQTQNPSQNYNMIPSPVPYPQQPMVLQTGINGRVISSDGEVTPNEIPMDGSVSLFPMNDYSCIYAKAWGTDGTIKTFRFVPAPIDLPDGGQKDLTDTDAYNSEVLDRLNRIEQMLINGNSNTVLNEATIKEEVNVRPNEAGSNVNEK